MARSQSHIEKNPHMTVWVKPLTVVSERQVYVQRILEMRFDLLNEVGFGLCSNQLVYNFPTLDKEDSGNAGDTIVYGQLRIVIDINLSYIDLAVVFLGQFFNDGTDSATGPAPFCPEVYDGQFIAGNHLVLKVGICKF